jgi:hypothetical protein
VAPSPSLLYSDVLLTLQERPVFSSASSRSSFFHFLLRQRKYSDLLSLHSFQRLVREIANGMGSEFRWQAAAILGLQEAAEA